jgi:lysophospholipase L1-like esterase
MKNLSLILIFLLNFQLSAKESKEKTILFLGDSLTAGYGVEKDQAYPALVALRK